MLRTCPNRLPQNILAASAALIEAYATSDIRPRLENKVAAHWRHLISEWSEATDMPLFIRKQRADIGKLLIHRATGRTLAPCDNSPANWSVTTAFTVGSAFTLKDVTRALEEHAIPAALTMSKTKKQNVPVKGTLNAKSNANAFGWKVDHIFDVGLKTRQDIENIDIDILKRHFKRLMDPSNIVLVPSALKGLGDMPGFLAYIKENG